MEHIRYSFPSTFLTPKQLTDILNNVEQIESNVDTGDYVLTVFGKNVPHGPQDYALVVTGDFDFYPSGCSGKSHSTWRYLLSSASCSNNCSSRGSCNSGVCFCSKGFTGVDCSI